MGAAAKVIGENLEKVMVRIISQVGSMYIRRDEVFGTWNKQLVSGLDAAIGQ